MLFLSSSPQACSRARTLQGQTKLSDLLLKCWVDVEPSHHDYINYWRSENLWKQESVLSRSGEQNLKKNVNVNKENK